MPFAWLTFVAGRQQLATRLADPANSFWSDAELGTYIVEALRVWNALTFTWKQTYLFNVTAASAPVWYSLGAMSDSPRARTLRDTDLYRAIQYHLLEPASGGVWTGTAQFTMAYVSLALQRCRDQLIQLTNSNAALLAGLKSQPATRSIVFPDTVLDVTRMRWVPADGMATTLQRTDATTLSYFQPGYLQTPDETPTQYDVADMAPLAATVDIATAVPGTYEAIVSQAGRAFTPPMPSPLSIPDDLTWLLKWGALGDLLSSDSESTDPVRAAWCKQRYADGLKVAEATPWLMQATLNDQPAYVISMAEMDRYSPEWDSLVADYAQVIIGGMDFFTVVPSPTADLSVNLTVLANAPVPVDDDDAIQCSRDEWDAVLDYAQFLAAWKQGGAEFQAATDLEKRFASAAMAKNARLTKLGLFANLFQQEGQRQDRAQERYPQQ